MHELRIGLFDPGMTYLHRLGLAGLYMTLQSVQESEGRFGELRFELTDVSVLMRWRNNGRETFDKLFRTAFGINESSPEGLIDFAAHRKLGRGDLQRYEMHQAILGSFLQHNKQNKIPTGTSRKRLVASLEGKQVVMEYRPLVGPYAHSCAANSLIDERGRLTKAVPIKNWLFPGAAERHSSLSGTEIQENPARFMCLLFAPVASLYFRISHKGRDGKIDGRQRTAICIPHVTNLKEYARCYTRYLRAPVQMLVANGLGDAGLSALVLLRSDDSIQEPGIAGCTVIMMGEAKWSTQQQSRTGVLYLQDVKQEVLASFESALRCFPHTIVFKGPNEADQRAEYFFSTSLARGLIAENIASGREWFAGFSQLMSSSELFKQVRYEKGGLAKMVQSNTDESAKKFIEAVHVAMRNRFGALAARAKQRGEKIRFDTEFERMRTGLMRAKNPQTLRSELADFFARGGVNTVLQKSWEQILTVFISRDWQRSRDLALIALASYAGKEVEQRAEDEPENNEEE